ncbi:MAG TPA: glycosyl hydrolase [Streptosporangiaceae bacterium]|nr:glycosyl hydrolase [Streptosporangiaceae bacterium]
MKTKLAAFLAVLIAVGAVSYAVTRVVLRSHTTPAAHASLPPRLASYLGVYEDGAPPAYQPIAGFGSAVGRQPNLGGYFSGWAQPFAASFADLLHEHGVAPFVQIDPTYASVAGIAAGDYDGYLRSYADSVKSFGHAVVIGFGHEMNAPWYSWGYGHVPASTFVAAWRHIVTVFRGQGADNVTWLWTINQDRGNTGPIQSWWPGSQYVTWVGIDGYYFRPTDTFSTVFGQTIDQVRAFTGKPILLSETAVGPQAGQFVKIGDLFQGMRKYHTLGLVWFDKAQHQGIYHQDWRIEGDDTATAAFRLGISSLTRMDP